MAKSTATTVQKEPTKMERAQELFARVTAKAAPEGKTHRGIFIELAMKEIGLSKPGANTYFQNLKSEANGEGRYPYSPSSKANAQAEVPPTQARRGRKPGKSTDDEIRAELDALRTVASDLNKTINRVAKRLVA